MRGLLFVLVGLFALFVLIRAYTDVKTTQSPEGRPEGETRSVSSELVETDY